MITYAKAVVKGAYNLVSELTKGTAEQEHGSFMNTAGEQIHDSRQDHGTWIRGNGGT